MLRLVPLLLIGLLTACGEGEPFTCRCGAADGGRYRGRSSTACCRAADVSTTRTAATTSASSRTANGTASARNGATGDRYEGEFKHGLFDGLGRFSYAEGGVYQGEFHAGRMHGHGRFSRDGTVYEGEFRNNLYHGMGRLDYADGLSHRGQFSQGQPEGRASAATPTASSVATSAPAA